MIKKTFRKYYLMCMFIGRRIFETIVGKVRDGVFLLPKKIHKLLAKPGYLFRAKMRKHYCEDDKNILDRVEYETLKEKAEQREKELQQSLALTRATLESTADAILMLRKEGGLIDWNQKFVELSEMPPEIVATKDERRGVQHVMNMLKDPVGLLELIKKLDESPEVKGYFDEVEFKNGRIFERYTQPHIVDGKIVGRVWSFRDITQRKHAEEALRLRDRAMTATTQGVLITDSKKQKIIYANPAFEKITGYSFAEVEGKNCRFLQGGESEQPELEKIRLAIKEQHEGVAELRNFRKDGKMFWNELHIAPVPDSNGKVTHFVGIVIDISERKAMEEQLLYQATHDALTNLPNRILLDDRITQGIIHAKRSDTLLGIMFLDLDRFKLVNDTLGHTLGDHLLNKIGEHLKEAIRESDTIARMGGDEFIFIISGLKKHEDILEIAEKVLQITATPINVDKAELNLTGSIGISFYPDDGQESTTLIKHADLAMYKAKDLGRNNYQFYTKELSEKISKRVEIEHDLRQAIENKEFVLYYQPVVSLSENRIIGAEALLRWNHPKRLIFPGEFIGVAEDSGLILPIGEWVIENACHQCAQWQKDGLSLYVSINVSARQFNQSNVVQQVSNALNAVNLDPNLVTVELTESILMQKSSPAISSLKELQKHGIKLSIDDFGTGYSSLSYLYTFNIDQLKIDQSFISGIGKNKDAEGIVLAIIALAKQLHIKVVAEGVETKQQLDFLYKNDCNQIQGYYFAKPMPVQEFIAYVRNFP